MTRYEPVPPFTWPTPGVRTWEPPEKSFFGSCNGEPDCAGPCPVGRVVTVDGGAYGCDCACHEEQRKT